MIRVTRVEVIPIPFRLVEGYRIAGHSYSIAENIIVKVGTTVTCDVSGGQGLAGGTVTFTFSDAEGDIDTSSVKTS